MSSHPDHPVREVTGPRTAFVPPDSRPAAVGHATGKTYLVDRDPPSSTWQRVERYEVVTDPDRLTRVLMERDLDSGESRPVEAGP